MSFSVLLRTDIGLGWQQVIRPELDKELEHLFMLTLHYLIDSSPNPRR